MHDNGHFGKIHFNSFINFSKIFLSRIHNPVCNYNRVRMVLFVLKWLYVFPLNFHKKKLSACIIIFNLCHAFTQTNPVIQKKSHPRNTICNNTTFILFLYMYTYIFVQEKSCRECDYA